MHVSCLLLCCLVAYLDGTLEQEGTRQSAYQAKMHVATAVRKVKAADVCVGCPGDDRLKALLQTVEGVLSELKKEGAGTGTDA